MRNIKLVVEYNGTNYVGWQRQKSRQSTVHSPQFEKSGKEIKKRDIRKDSIQGTIEEATYKITGKKVNVIGSGRTDAGVHARGQVANFKTETNLKLKELQNAFNAVLSEDILIRKIEEADMNFNARYDAKSKCYQYSIINTKFCSPFYKRFYAHISYPFNFGLMKKEAEILIGKNDFKTFQAQDKREKDSVREIYELSFGKKNDIITIQIVANGFLYKMVRSIVGTLIEIGRGKLPPGSMKKILISKNRKLSGPTAPPEGLCLVKVKY